ncbi:MAG: hypothetical protein L3J43_07710 [Sulfurovum sp.]|nr:hypothetical protein [Sulfurovum sp.]
MKKNTILLSLIAVPFLVGCGGGSSDTTAAVATAKISGTVPGTLIEAFCEDGTYVQVASTQNGTNQHPFELNIPQNTNCKLVMTTNENNDTTRVITPIGFINGTTTGSTITMNGDINFFHIPLELDYNNANDADGDHVIDQPLQVDLNNSTNIGINNTSVYDTDKNGHIDAYDDDDNDGRVNAYEDDDNDGTENIHDDDNDDKPDYLEDNDKDGELNHRDDDDDNGHADYTEDTDDDGIPNHIDDDDDNDGIEDDDDDYTPSGGMPTPTPTSTMPTAKMFSADVMPILNSNCKSCHGSAGNFTVTTAGATYTNTMALSGGAQYMLEKGNGMQSHGAGDKLNDTEYATIQSWIDTGAMNN